MKLVERHIILDNRFEEICKCSGELYNFVTYNYRQAIFGNQAYFSEYEISGACAEFDQENYRSLPAQTSQQVIKQVFQNFKAFFTSKKEYSKNKGKFLGRPKLPKYKKGNKQNLVVFTNQTCSLKNNYIHFPKKTNLKPIKTNVTNFQQIRIVPQSSCYVVEVVYNKEVENLNLEKENFLSIDLGLNNYVSTINNTGSQPFIINGKIMKSFNQYYNKKKSSLQSKLPQKQYFSKSLNKLNHYRNNWIEDKNHKVSRFIVNYCIENNIGIIIIGHNKSWKNEIEIGKRNNQHFVNLPHSKLIDKIKYKSELVGIEVKITEESYTSKIDHLALESLCKQETYLGKRIKRGLFQSSVGKLINADINGAIGIARKVIGDDFIRNLTNSGLVFNPRIINIT